MKPLLIFIDFQQDYLARPNIEPATGMVIEKASRLLSIGREQKLLIAHVRTAVSRTPDNRLLHWQQENRWPCEIGTAGYEPPFQLKEQAGEPVFHKVGFSGFSQPQLANFIDDNAVDTIVLAGLYSHACVRQTAIDGYQLGLKVWIIEDAIASDDPIHAAITHRYLADRAVRFSTFHDFQKTVVGAPSSEQCSPAHPQSVSDTVRATVRVAANCAASWQHVNVSSRIIQGQLLIKALADAAPRLAELIAKETGKPIRFCRQEVKGTKTMLQAILSRAATTDLQTALHLPHHHVEEGVSVRRRPHGTVAIITPFNNPIFIPLGKIFPALLYGNTVVWKPAPEATQTSLQVMKLLDKAGFSDGVVNYLAGDRIVGQALLNDPQIDAVTITGSSAAGFSAQEVCAHRRIPLQAELGGNNAAIVWSDADLIHAAEQIAAGAFDMAGQRCTANRRVIVHYGIYEKFLVALKRASQAIPWGDPLEETTRIGPLVSSSRCQLIASLVKRTSQQLGSPLWHQAPLPPFIDRNINNLSENMTEGEIWYPPTIIRCDDPQHEIVQEETFGPVLVVQTARSWQEAIELCTSVKQGLSAAIFTADANVTQRFLDQAQAGILKVNCSTAGAAVDAPFGGWKSSGLGPPEHGKFDLDSFTRSQTIYQNAS